MMTPNIQNFTRITILLSIIIMLCSNTAKASTYESASDGEWSAGSTWTKIGAGSNMTFDCNPTANHTLNIDDSVYIDCPTGFSSGGNLTINVLSSGVLYFQADAGVTGSVEFNIALGAKVVVIGDFTVGGSSKTDNNGSFEIQGTLTGSTSKYFDCDGSNGTGTITVGSGTGACDVCTDGAGNCSLPVEYISINAEKTNDNTIELSWLTASEENNDYFIVQKSTDGINWIEIAQVNGAGTSSTINNYSIIDENTSTGHNYYRLVQVDFDGRYEISKIVSVLLTNNIFLTVYPNPSQQSTGTFTVLVNGMDEDALFQLTVVDLTGKSWDVSTENENTNLVTVLHELAAGTYLVQVIIDNKQMIERLVIQ